MTEPYFKEVGEDTYLVKAGSYVLGDPCYAFGNDDHGKWIALLESCDYFGDSAIGSSDGKDQVLSFGTFYGDGNYPSNIGKMFAVDAGMIGLVPLEYADRIPEDDETLNCVVTFVEDVIASTDGSGLLKFGYIEIQTNDTHDEEEESW